MKVYDGPDNSSALIGTYCGQQRNLVLYSSESSLFVHFYTLPRTANSQNRGFKGIYEFSESFVKLDFIRKYYSVTKQLIYNYISVQPLYPEPWRPFCGAANCVGNATKWPPCAHIWGLSVCVWSTFSLTGFFVHLFNSVAFYQLIYLIYNLTHSLFHLYL